MMWFLLLLLHIAHVELVVPEDVKKLILKRTTRGNPCEGYLNVLYKNTWGYVGDVGWSKETEKVVCKSTHCGEPVEHLTTNMVQSLKGSTIWLNELECRGNEGSLWDCKHPGWNASFYQRLTVKKVTCSSNITISLDKSKCAGAVKFSDGETSGYFCNDGWDHAKQDVLCKNLGCGGVRKIFTTEWAETETFRKSAIKMKFNCSVFGDQGPDNLWQCVTDKHIGDQHNCKPVAVKCEDHKRLQLKGNRSNVCSGQLEEENNGVWAPATQNFTFDVCELMNCGTTQNKTSDNVICTDKVKVVLKDSTGKESSCFGVVNIQVNDSVMPVCASKWGKEEAELVCKELNCGKLIYLSTTTVKSKGAMNYVKCDGSESSLWHCEAQRQSVDCVDHAMVVCSDSVKVKLVEGPGKCAGRLAIELEGQLRRVASTSWKDSQSATVCNELNCGTAGKSETFIQGSGSFLSIDCADKDISKISDCLTKSSATGPNQGQDQAVGITCKEHKVVVLNGDEACSGDVQIQHGSETYWLSGSNATWNNESAQTVCQQMHCGSAKNFSSEPAGNNSIWNESRTCSSTEKSLFDCKETALQSTASNQTAKVKCSGKIEMKLANVCWGKVKISADEVQDGDVCADTWTEEMSRMLCGHLDCGTPIKVPHTISRNGDIKFNSLHKISGKNLTQWNLVRSQTAVSSCKERPAYVVCSGSVKPRFSSHEYCSGNLEMQSEGQWIPVCSKALENKTTSNTICQQLNCGDAIKPLPYFGPKPKVERALSGLTCPAGATGLHECSIDISNSDCKYSGLQCAEWKAMGLTNSQSCSGTVVVHSEKGISALSKKGWAQAERNRLCKDIKCGQPETVNETLDQKIEISSFWSKSFNCTNGLHSPKNIWECEKEEPPEKDGALFIKCKDEPKVTLSQGCHGEVRIDDIPVWFDNWERSYAHKVCQEKSCGIAVDLSKTKSQYSDDIYYVSCENYHSVLGQCRRIREKNSDGNVVSVFCSKNVTFRTNTDGGQVQVNYRNKWETICADAKEKERLCNETSGHANEKDRTTEKTALKCGDNGWDIKRCITQESCGSLKPVSCKVEPAQTPKPPSEPPSLATIIVSVALLLLVVILIVLFIRFYVRRSRKSRVSSRMLSTQDMEYESGEYEDVMSKENELEDFSTGRLGSEDKFIRENDRNSVSSLPYDDIDEADDARSLGSPGAAAPAERGANMHEDGVTYEVEDPQESYDDIDTIHETTQTKAEVHDSRQTTRDTAAPPGLAQRDEDYLEPDQDG